MSHVPGPFPLMIALAIGINLVGGRSATARDPSQPATAASAAGDKPPRTKRLTPAAIGKCAAFPERLTSAPPTGPFAAADGKSGPLFGQTLAPSSHTDLPVLAPLIYLGRSRFQQNLHAWSKQIAAATMAHGGAGGAEGIVDLEAQSDASQMSEDPRTSLEVAPGRRARTGSANLGTGRTIFWATLSSPHATYDLTVVSVQYDDAFPLAAADRQAVQSLAAAPALPRLLACLDATLWPR